MAKNTTEAEVIVTLNGQAARNELKRLETEIEHYERAATDAYKAGDKALGDKMSKNASQLRKQFNVAKKEMKDFSDMMKTLNSKSLNELKSAASQLRKQLGQLVPGTQQFIDKSKQLQQVNSRIKSLEASFKAVVTEEKRATLSLKGLADGFNKYFGMVTAGVAAITGLSMAFRKAAEEAAKLDDVYSDVMKTTGLLHEEVEGLDEELMKIDTRTSREQLLLLARDAGKLGIQGKDNILGFVRAADQIQVALGEDLGEGAIRNLGKIADVLGYTSSMGIEKALLSIASSINAVGQASTASEAYLVDFTQRLAGVAAQTKISAANIIGFASGLDQSAMKVEMAATAFQKFVMKLYEDPAKFAEYANMEVKAFTDLLQNDANQAIITILKALKDQDGFASLVPIFKEMGLDGARAVSVLAAMATNIDAVTDAQALANQEFSKATSVTDEYLVKNNNLNAQLDKARKEFKNASIALGQSLNPIMLKSTKLVTYLIKALATYGKEIRNVAITLAVLTAAVKANTIAHTVYQAVVKGITVVQKTFTVAINAASYAFNILRGRTVAATKAYLAMKAAMSASVFGAIATAASALVVVITRLVNKEKEAANAMSYVQSVEKKVVETYAEEEAKLRTLHAIVRDNNISIDQRRKALQELQEIVPEYHASLSKEGQLIEGNTVFLEKYIEKLREATRWQVYKDEWQDLERQLIEVQDKITEFQQKAQDELTRNGGNATEKVETIVDTWGGGTKVQEYYTKYGEYMRSVNFYREKETELMAKQQEIHGKMGQMRKQDTRELTEQEKEIDAIQKKYELLFAEAKNAYVGAPAEGMKAMGKLQEQMNKEIELVRKKYASPTTTTDGGNGGNGNSYNTANKTIDKQIDLQKQIRERIAEELELAKYEQEWQDRFDYSDRLQDPSIADPKANEEFWDKIYSQRDKIVAQLEDQSLSKEYETEMMWLEKLHQNKLLSEETYEKLVFKTKVKYLEKYTEQTSQIANQASNLVAAIREAETAQLEAQYQAQLTAAGDNAEEREKIEAEYEQKKLDMQKKYADVDMVIQIAQAVSAGALGAIQAYTAAKGNPVLGSIYAAIIAATTAAQVATIIAQRDAIKNASVNSSGSSASTNTGKRTLTGYAEGGYTEDHTTLTTVGEKGTEYVIPHWMVRKNPVMVANLERYRRSGSHGRSGSVSRGFADGGFTYPTSSASLPSMDVSNVDWQAMREFNSIMRYCAENGLFVKYGDIMMAKKKHDTFKNQTTR